MSQQVLANKHNRLSVSCISLQKVERPSGGLRLVADKTTKKKHRSIMNRARPMAVRLIIRMVDHVAYNACTG